MYIGVPAVLNSDGIARVIEKPLDEQEQAQFEKSANILRGYQEKVADYLK